MAQELVEVSEERLLWTLAQQLGRHILAAVRLWETLRLVSLSVLVPHVHAKSERSDGGETAKGGGRSESGNVFGFVLCLVALISV